MHFRQWSTRPTELQFQYYILYIVNKTRVLYYILAVTVCMGSEKTKLKYENMFQNIGNVKYIVSMLEYFKKY